MREVEQLTSSGDTAGVHDCEANTKLAADNSKLKYQMQHLQKVTLVTAIINCACLTACVHVQLLL